MVNDPKPHLLITRPRDSAERTAAILRTHGFETTIFPLLNVSHLTSAHEELQHIRASNPVDGIILTSQHAVSFLAASTIPHDVSVYTLGEATAESAQTCGFSQTHIIGHNAEELCSALQPIAKDKHFLYLRGKTIRYDIAEELRATGARVHEIMCYETQPLQQPDDAILTAMKNGEYNGVLFFSARTAHIFSSCVKNFELAAACRQLQAVAISDGIADMLTGLPFSSVHICPLHTRRREAYDCLKACFGVKTSLDTGNM